MACLPKQPSMMRLIRNYMIRCRANRWIRFREGCYEICRQPELSNYGFIIALNKGHRYDRCVRRMYALQTPRNVRKEPRQTAGSRQQFQNNYHTAVQKRPEWSLAKPAQSAYSGTKARTPAVLYLREEELLLRSSILSGNAHWLQLQCSGY